MFFQDGKPNSSTIHIRFLSRLGKSEIKIISSNQKGFWPWVTTADAEKPFLVYNRQMNQAAGGCIALVKDCPAEPL